MVNQPFCVVMSMNETHALDLSLVRTKTERVTKFLLVNWVIKELNLLFVG